MLRWRSGKRIMSAEIDEIEVLSSLGLKLSEAKVFAALSKLGVSLASAVSKESGVAREFVYQILPKLIKKGLVEETITVPKMFQVIPLSDAYEILLTRKEEENRILHVKAMQNLKRLQSKPPSKRAADPQTSLVPSFHSPDTRIGQEYEKVEEGIDFIFPMEKFLQWSRYYAEAGIKQALKKGVKIRIITQWSLTKIFASHPELFTQSFKAKLKCIDFKYVRNPFSVEMIIFDRKTLFVSTVKEKNINKMIWLRTNNPLILEMANGYYEAMWEKALESWK
jgi:sugar-specific transcriptional regulator TrmB